jgi:integral membrane sensor domain MASE1
MRLRAQGFSRRGPAVAVLAGAAYFGTSMGVFALIDPNATGSAWWPASGLTLGVLLLVRRREWPLILAAVAAADIGADILQRAPTLTSIAWAASNCLEPVLGALVLSRLFGGGTPTLGSARDVRRFLGAAALAGPPIASLIGTIASVVTWGQPLLPTWPRWYAGDVLGIVVVAPAVLYLPLLRRALSRRLVFELALVVAITLLVFGGASKLLGDSAYLALPPLVLVAFADGPAGAAYAAFVSALIANVASALGHGPFALSSDPDALLDLQIYTAVTLIMVWLIAATTSDLGRTHASLSRLETSFWHVTRDQEVLPLCMGCGQVSPREGEWQDLSTFFHDRTDFLSHGYCPPCAEGLLGEGEGPLRSEPLAAAPTPPTQSGAPRVPPSRRIAAHR